MVQSGKSSSKKSRSQLEYPFATAPGPGQALEVVPGVFWACLPLPGGAAPVNVWAIADGEGLAVVDTGVNTQKTAAAWSQMFAGAFAGRPVTRVFVTHWHPDHAGMAGWMTRKFACRLWITQLEYLTCRVMAKEWGQSVSQDGISFYQNAGWDAERIDTYLACIGDVRKRISAPPDSFQRMRDGDRFAIGEHDWRVVVGNGHSPEHACLYCPDLRLLISGDQVLPEVSSVLMVGPIEPNADPVTDWMTSLAKLKRELPDDVLVLPSHQQPFRNLHARLDDLTREKEHMLQRLRLALNEPKRVTDLFGDLFGSKTYSDPILFGWVTGSTIASLNHLLGRGELVKRADTAGALWYSLAQAAVLTR